MRTTVTVLGTGIMGSGMARNLIAAGLDVTVWNRSPDRARSLADAGARMAQAVAFAEGLGLDPQLFLDTIAGGSLDMPYVQLKGKAMIAGEFAPSFAVSGVVKDVGLIAAAMRGVDVRTDVVDAVAVAFRTTADAGHGGADMAAVIHAFRSQR